MEAQGGGGGGEPDSAWVRTLTHTYYYYSGNEVSVVVEKADNGTILDWSHNVYAVGRKICSASRGALAAEALTKNFIVADHQGNVRNVFNYDAQQNIVLNAAYWYNPFGKQDSVVVYGTGGHRFTYNDKELDDELGFEMYYYGARFYDPSIGRFSSPDPVKDYHNPYSYVRNNPIRFVDPTGMASNGSSAAPGGTRLPHGGRIVSKYDIFFSSEVNRYNWEHDESKLVTEEQYRQLRLEDAVANSSREETDVDDDKVTDPSAVDPTAPSHPVGPPSPSDDLNGNGEWDVDELQVIDSRGNPVGPMAQDPNESQGMTVPQRVGVGLVGVASVFTGGMMYGAGALLVCTEPVALGEGLMVGEVGLGLVVFGSVLITWSLLGHL